MSVQRLWAVTCDAGGCTAEVVAETMHEARAKARVNGWRQVDVRTVRGVRTEDRCLAHRTVEVAGAR